VPTFCATCRPLSASSAPSPLLGSLFETNRRRTPLRLDGIEWLTVGGESGPRARPMQLEWVRELQHECAAAGVSFFLKQLGGVRDKRGGEKALLDGRIWRALPRDARAPVAAAAA